MKQTKFTLTLPTNDSVGNPLPADDITGLKFLINAAGGPVAVYDYTLPAGTADGATIDVLFSDLKFVPAAGQSYTAQVESVDSTGVSVPTAALTWTEAAPPAPPTNFSVG